MSQSHQNIFALESALIWIRLSCLKSLCLIVTLHSVEGILDY